MFFLTFFCFFFGCFRWRFVATLLEIRRWLFHKKGRKCKKSVHVFQRFSIFKAIWRSRNLECVYTFSTKAVLQPPCWRYGGGFSTKKIDNQKIGDTFVFLYLKPFGTHATSNFSIYRYIYFSHSVGDMEVALLQKSGNLEFCYSYVFIYIYIYIYTNSRVQ